MDVFYALAEPRRRRIVEIVAKSGALSATEISNRFNITAQAISQHLRVLLEAKILRMEKHAQQHIYRINSESMVEVEEWAKQTRELWNARFDALDKLLAAEKKRNAK